MRKLLSILLALAVAALAPTAQAASTKSWNTLSTLLAVGLPAVAGVESLNQDDMSGVGELALSEAAAVVSVEALKSVVHERRPDGSGNDSFPSGHTAVAFAAARYLDKRYGGDNGWLLYSLAAFTGVARVEAKKHYWGDVLVGGAIGYVAADFSTHNRYSTLSVTPTQGGLQVQWNRSW